MTMRGRQRQKAFTIIEALIALAVIGIAFAALSSIIVTNLRASTTSRVSTEVKANANVVLERLLDRVLAVDTSEASPSYSFTDYYWSCPDSGVTGTPPPDYNDVSASCEGTHEDVAAEDSVIDGIEVTYRIVAGSGIEGEGYVTIVVTSTDDRLGQTLTIGDRITCYDVYPAPTVTQPRPCPAPVADGGGWR